MKTHKKPISIILTALLLASASYVLILGRSHVATFRPLRLRVRKRSLVVKKSSARKAAAVAAKPKAVAKPKTVKPIKNESAAMKKILASTTGLDPKVLAMGLHAYTWASAHHKVQKRYLTIVNFSIPSKNKRLWIINLNTNKVEIKTLVANGKYSGLYKGTNFSNGRGTRESSLGVYLTGVTYYGNDGLSMHVHGLQPGINSNAYRRTIEFHGAAYVSPQFAKAHGRVGRSFGCFALDKAIVGKVTSIIKGGSVVFAYADNHSRDFQVEASA